MSLYLKYMDEWEKFNETLLPKKEDFSSKLKMEDIKNSDYNHAKVVCKDFETKILGEYHELYFRSKRLLLTKIFESLRKMCFEIYEPDTAEISFSYRISMASSFKRD